MKLREICCDPDASSAVCVYSLRKQSVRRTAYSALPNDTMPAARQAGSKGPVRRRKAGFAGMAVFERRLAEGNTWKPRALGIASVR
jgi:hypothetical protein